MRAFTLLHGALLALCLGVAAAAAQPAAAPAVSGPTTATPLADVWQKFVSSADFDAVSLSYAALANFAGPDGPTFEQCREHLPGLLRARAAVRRQRSSRWKTVTRGDSGRQRDTGGFRCVCETRRRSAKAA